MIEVINARLLLAAGKKGGWHIPLEKIHELIILKQQVIDRMAELDPHPFWMGEERRNYLISNSILTPGGWEFNVTTLRNGLSKLNAGGKNSSFYKNLLTLRQGPG